MSFFAQFAAYQKAINADIAAYASHTKKATKQQYGEYPGVVTDEYFDLLLRGGKRLRGTLTVVGYEMLGGRDKTMILRAATAMEMLHAAMLIIDDIQDRDVARRGKPAAHIALAKYHKKLRMQGDAAATGNSLAINAALAGSHAAQVLLAGLDADAELKVKVLGIVNYTIVLTLHGQTYDVINQGLESPKPEDIARATEWKSAHYTWLNPLCVGMVLAGAECEDTNAIRDYALNAGIAFQLADDIMDDDIKSADVSVARQQATAFSRRAIAALDACPQTWGAKNVAFLRDMAHYATMRQE